jgi:WD40 repeat protein
VKSRYATSVAFSPKGSQLAGGSEDGTIKVWDAATGQSLHTLRGHTGRVYTVAFNSDGSRLASGSMDHTTKVWNPISGQELRTLKGHSSPVFSVAFHPDGSRLASGSLTGKLVVWDARSLTPEVRRQREALALVEFLCRKSSSKEKVIEGIRADKGITDEVRHEALSLLDDYWPRHAPSKTAVELKLEPLPTVNAVPLMWGTKLAPFTSSSETWGSIVSGRR